MNPKVSLLLPYRALHLAPLAALAAVNRTGIVIRLCG